MSPSLSRLAEAKGLNTLLHLHHTLTALTLDPVKHTYWQWEWFDARKQTIWRHKRLTGSDCANQIQDLTFNKKKTWIITVLEYYMLKCQKGPVCPSHWHQSLIVYRIKITFTKGREAANSFTIMDVKRPPPMNEWWVEKKTPSISTGAKKFVAFYSVCDLQMLKCKFF